MNLADEPALAGRVLAMRRRLEQFFLRYGDPALDGALEGVTGSGQLGLAGLRANRADTYAPAPVTRKKQASCTQSEGREEP